MKNNNLKVKIKRINDEFELPLYQTEGSVGFDFSSSKELIISPKTIEMVPTNCIIEVPEGYMLGVLPRSSTPLKGLMVANSLGVIDQDYCGPKDEIKVLLYNFTDKPVIIKKNERIAQGVFFKVAQVDFVEVSEIKEKSRNGFGSTGH